MKSVLSLILLLCLKSSVIAQGNVRFPIHVKNASLYYRCYDLIYEDFIGTGYDPKNDFFIFKSHRSVLPRSINMLVDFDIRGFQKRSNNLSFEFTKLSLLSIRKSELC